MPRPDLSRMPEYYHKYINQAKEDDLMTALRSNTSSFLSLLKMIPPDKQDHRYAEGKWTIKEVLQHIIDIERVFTYRALRFARKDKLPCRDLMKRSLQPAQMLIKETGMIWLMSSLLSGKPQS